MPGSVVSTSTPMATRTEVVAASRSPVMMDGTAPGRFTDPLEHAAWDLTRALVRYGGELDDGRYEEARAVLGERTLFELSTLVGHYGTLALQLRLFAVPEPRDE